MPLHWMNLLGAAATQAKSMFDAYISSDLYKLLPKKQKRELEFVQPLQQELAAEGVIDLLAFDEDDNMIIVDYKTGTPPERRGEAGLCLSAGAV